MSRHTGGGGFNRTRQQTDREKRSHTEKISLSKAAAHRMWQQRVHKAGAGGFRPCSNYFPPQTTEGGTRARSTAWLWDKTAAVSKSCAVRTLHSPLQTFSWNIRYASRMRQVDEVCWHQMRPRNNRRRRQQEFTWTPQKDTPVHNGHDVKGDLRAAAAVNVPSTVLAATPFRFRVKKKRKIKNAFLKYTAFLCLQYISLATIVPFWINLLSC